MGQKRKSMVHHLVENQVNTVEQALIKYAKYIHTQLQIEIFKSFYNIFFYIFPYQSLKSKSTYLSLYIESYFENFGFSKSSLKFRYFRQNDSMKNLVSVKRQLSASRFTFYLHVCTKGEKKFLDFFYYCRIQLHQKKNH